MIQEMVQAMTQAIYTVAPDIPIYDAQTEQPFKVPCFHIVLKAMNQKKNLGNRYQQTYSYDVRYYPAENIGAEVDVRRIQELAVDALEWIEVSNKPVKGLDIRAEYAEGMLHVFVDYQVSVIEVGDPDGLMEQLEIKN